jgi:hypothetical protein
MTQQDNPFMNELFKSFLSGLKKESPEEKTPNESGESEAPDLEEKACESSDNLVLLNEANGPIEGLIVFYIEVGQMPPQSITKHLQRARASYELLLARLPDKYAVIFVPRRVQPSSVEIIRF